MGYLAPALAHLQFCLLTPTGNLVANGNPDLISYTIPQLEAYLKV
jgi:hypothetical protein